VNEFRLKTTWGCVKSFGQCKQVSGDRSPLARFITPNEAWKARQQIISPLSSQRCVNESLPCIRFEDASQWC